VLRQQLWPRSTWGPAGLVSLAMLLAVTSRAEAQIPHETLLKSLSSYAGRAGSLEVARSEAELEPIWRELGNPGPLPDVDFRKHTVLVYFMGDRPSSGYDADVTEISIRGGVMHVGVTESSPGRRCGGVEILTAPAIAVTTIPWRGPVSLDLTKVEVCGP
jgi:hypothetical protein